MSVKKQSKSIAELEINGLGIVRSGKLVQHEIFGVGQVADIVLWENGDHTANIIFHDHGSKWLSPEYEKLREPKVNISKPNVFSELASLFSKDG